MKTINVGLIGFGTVGSGLAEVLLSQQQRLVQRSGLSLHLTKVADINITELPAQFASTTLTADAADLINDPAIESVSVGIQLPATNFIDDQVDTAGVSAALWTVATDHGDGSVLWAIDDSGQCPDCGGVEAGAAAAWRFAYLCPSLAHQCGRLGGRH